MKCIAKTKNGKRCKKQSTADYVVCRQHLHVVVARVRVEWRRKNGL